MLPSANYNGVGTHEELISRLNSPACTYPCQRFTDALANATHDSGPPWIATPSVSDSLIPFSMPVYPGYSVVPLGVKGVAGEVERGELGVGDLDALGVGARLGAVDPRKYPVWVKGLRGCAR
jgi:hypothetical protein